MMALAIVLLLAACRLPSADVELAPEPLPAPDREPKVFVEASSEPRGDPLVPGINDGECPAQLASYPEPYFTTRVLLRLPEPVSSTDFVEVTPTRAQLVAPVMLPTCKPDRPNVALEQMIAEWLDPDRGDPLESVRDEVLRRYGLLDGATLIEADQYPDRRMGQWVFETPTHTRLVVIIGANSALLVLIYETATADWPLVVNSFRESARRASFLRP
jgi:hypothetical protein